jgi:hypothetical protein
LTSKPYLHDDYPVLKDLLLIHNMVRVKYQCLEDIIWALACFPSDQVCDLSEGSMVIFGDKKLVGYVEDATCYRTQAVEKQRVSLLHFTSKLTKVLVMFISMA